MTQIIYNSFPRSGNVYAGYVGSSMMNRDYATVHIPQIFGTQGLDMISIFRKPQDAIASLINKRLQSAEHKIISLESIKNQVQNHCNNYKEYIDNAKKHSDSIYIINFDDLVSDTLNQFINISNKFNIKLMENYEESFYNLKFVGNMWEDKYDGHIPRNKDDIRLLIEDMIGSLSSIQEINEEYKDFIKEYKSY